jgi:hypothetical protein
LGGIILLATFYHKKKTIPLHNNHPPYPLPFLEGEEINQITSSPSNSLFSFAIGEEGEPKKTPTTTKEESHVSVLL